MGRIQNLPLLPDKFSSLLDEDCQKKVEEKIVKAEKIGKKSCKDCYGKGYIKRNFLTPFNLFEYCGKCLRKYRNKRRK